MCTWCGCVYRKASVFMHKYVHVYSLKHSLYLVHTGIVRLQLSFMCIILLPFNITNTESCKIMTVYNLLLLLSHTPTGSPLRVWIGSSWTQKLAQQSRYTDL